MHDTTQEPKPGELPSGRFVVRIDPRLHAALRDAAERSGVPLNEYCRRKLGFPMSGITAPSFEIVMRAASLFGDELVGVVAFGSWTRDELAQSSDVDVLVIVEPSVDINRKLYRDWDSRPLSWDGHPVDPHFVHLPESADRLSGVWAEVAVDGVVLFDRDLSVSAWLVEIRRRIAAGELVRRQAHGQPYWVGAA